MPCIPLFNRNKRRIGFMCVSTELRLRLADGRRVFMEWHSYLGPTFFHDRHFRRLIEDWWEDPMICAALDWFCKRGHVA